MFDLSPDAEGQLEFVQLTIDKQVKLILTDKWEDLRGKDLGDRVKLHGEILDKLLKGVVDLFHLADMDGTQPDVKECIDKAVKAYRSFKSKIENYISTHDLSDFLDSEDKDSSAKIRAEVELQSDMSSYLGRATTSYKKLPAPGEKAKLNISMMKGELVPLAYIDGFSKKHPEIKAIIDNAMESINKPVKKKKNGK